MAENKLARERKRLKKKKPDFERHESYTMKKLDKKWRKPKGDKNSQRTRHRGRAKMPTRGYGTPESVRGLNRQGMVEVRVSNPGDVGKLDPKVQEAVISRTVGKKKRFEMLEKAKELGIKVSNPKSTF